MVDVLFLSPGKLYELVDEHNFDPVFGLAGAAIHAALEDYREGIYNENPVQVTLWRAPYRDIMSTITELRRSVTGSEFLDNMQSTMVRRGRTLIRNNV